MKSDHPTINGRAALVCGHAKTSVAFTLILSRDRSGKRKATGWLHNADSSVIAMATKASTCQLILEDGRELNVQVSVRGGGTVFFRSSGEIPELG